MAPNKPPAPVTAACLMPRKCRRLSHVRAGPRCPIARGAGRRLSHVPGGAAACPTPSRAARPSHAPAKGRARCSRSSACGAAARPTPRVRAAACPSRRRGPPPVPTWQPRLSDVRGRRPSRTQGRASVPRAGLLPVSRPRGGAAACSTSHVRARPSRTRPRAVPARGRRFCLTSSRAGRVLLEDAGPRLFS